MTNRYYDNTLVAIPLTTIRSQTMLQQMDTIEAGFDAVQVEMDSKAPANNATLTGTVTFTGVLDALGVSAAYVPTISIPSDSTNKIASTAFVQSVLGAAGALLPPQANLAGKVLRTNGTSYSWQWAVADQATHAGKFLTTNGSADSWAFPSFNVLLDKPTTLQGYGITNAQFAIEVSASGKRRITGPMGLDFDGFDVTVSRDRAKVHAPVFPHFLLLEQGII